MYYLKDIYKETFTCEKSQFIAMLIPLEDISKVKEKLTLLKKEYPKANHYCYAYIFDGYIKFSDDGEPSQTAGKPILNVLQMKNVNRVLGVVIRYFGGIKLGASNLLRTYVNAITNCFKNVELYIKKELDKCKLTFDYKYVDAMMYYLEKNNYQIIEKNFFEKVSLVFLKENFDKKELIARFNGNILVEELGKEESYIKV